MHHGCFNLNFKGGRVTCIQILKKLLNGFWTYYHPSIVIHYEKENERYRRNENVRELSRICVRDGDGRHRDSSGKFQEKQVPIWIIRDGLGWLWMTRRRSGTDLSIQNVYSRLSSKPSRIQDSHSDLHYCARQVCVSAKHGSVKNTV